MKKTLLTVMLLFLVQSCVEARNVKVEALSSFSTANPPKTWQVKTMEDIEVKDHGTIPTGSIITGKIENIRGPQRGKRNARFTFVPIYLDVEGQVYAINKNIKGEYSFLTNLTAESITKKGVVVVGNKVLDGFFGPGVAVVEGAVKNEEGNRAKSAAVSLYESTPLSYISKGKELEIPEGFNFIMSFKEDKD